MNRFNIKLKVIKCRMATPVSHFTTLNSEDCRNGMDPIWGSCLFLSFHTGLFSFFCQHGGDVVEGTQSFGGNTGYLNDLGKKGRRHSQHIESYLGLDK